MVKTPSPAVDPLAYSARLRRMSVGELGKMRNELARPNRLSNTALRNLAHIMVDLRARGIRATDIITGSAA